MVVRKYSPSLDGLRFVAFLLVFLFHALPFAKEIGISPVILNSLKVFQLGWMGVDIFFVLSGYLITTSLLQSRSHPRYFSNFYKKRVLRIFPLYYAVLAIIFVSVPLAIPEFRLQHPGLFEAWPYFVTHMQNWYVSFPPIESVLVLHFWSLAVEEQFYLVWPLCVFFIPPDRRGALICGSGIIVVMFVRIILLSVFRGSVSNLLQFSSFSRADTLVAGSAISYLVLSVPRFSSFAFVFKFSSIIIALTSISLALFALDSPFFNWQMQTFGYTLIALDAAALVMLLRLQDCDTTFFAARPMRYLGKISYGLYVFHWPCLGALALIFEGWGLSGHYAGILFLVVSFMTTTALSILSYEFFEKIFLRMKSRMTEGE